MAKNFEDWWKLYDDENGDYLEATKRVALAAWNAALANEPEKLEKEYASIPEMIRDVLKELRAHTRYLESIEEYARNTYNLK